MHLGEVQSTGFFAVGPGCLHKNGNRYEIIDDSPVATLEYEKLLTILKAVSIEKQGLKQNNTRTNDNNTTKYDHDVDITKIATPDNANKKWRRIGRREPIPWVDGGEKLPHEPTQGSVGMLPPPQACGRGMDRAPSGKRGDHPLRRRREGLPEQRAIQTSDETRGRTRT